MSPAATTKTTLLLTAKESVLAIRAGSVFNARAASSTVADDCDNSITALPSAAKKCLTFSIVIGYGYRWR